MDLRNLPSPVFDQFTDEELRRQIVLAKQFQDFCNNDEEEKIKVGKEFFGPLLGYSDCQWEIEMIESELQRRQMESKFVFTFGLLQKQNRVWADHNFPDRYHNTWMPLMGICEELGEIVEAYDELNSHFGQDKKDKLIDGCADIMIFMSDYCNLHEIDMDQIRLFDLPLAEIGHSSLRDSLTKYIGRLCHTHLKLAQGIRYSIDEAQQRKLDALRGITFVLQAICQKLDKDLMEVVAQTWANVKLRDWKKNPTDANKQVEGSL